MGRRGKQGKKRGEMGGTMGKREIELGGFGDKCGAKRGKKENTGGKTGEKGVEKGGEKGGEITVPFPDELEQFSVLSLYFQRYILRISSLQGRLVLPKVDPPHLLHLLPIKYKITVRYRIQKGHKVHVVPLVVHKGPILQVAGGTGEKYGWYGMCCCTEIVRTLTRGGGTRRGTRRPSREGLVRVLRGVLSFENGGKQGGNGGN